MERVNQLYERHKNCTRSVWYTTKTPFKENPKRLDLYKKKSSSIFITLKFIEKNAYEIMKAKYNDIRRAIRLTSLQIGRE